MYYIHKRTYTVFVTYKEINIDINVVIHICISINVYKV